MSAGDHIRSVTSGGFSINQTSFLFGATMFAFIFFITVRGDLGKWLGLLGLAGSGAPATTATPTTASATPALPALPTLDTLPSLSGI